MTDLAGAVSSPPAKPPAVPTALFEALDRATANAEAGWQQVAEDSPSQEEVRGQLLLLRHAIEQVAAGNPGSVDGLPRTVLARRLVELVRRAFVEAAEALVPAPDGQALLSVFCAIEKVNRALEPDWAQHFADRLSGPDGMNSSSRLHTICARP